jgi:TolA-binding protein
MARILFLNIFAFCFLQGAEVSAFGAGDLNSPTPYGLTSAEKHILTNKTKLDKFGNSVNSISERIEAIESIIEGDSKKLHDTKIKVNNLEQNDIKNIKLAIEKLVEDQVQIIENQEKLKQSIDSLTKLLNSINSAYVSQNELKSNMSQFVTKKEFDKLISVLDKGGVKTASSSKSKADMMEEGRALFKKKYFTKAIPIFEELIRLNYKPAESNYTLGEMWFVRKKYKKAISYFKQSALLYDKGWWMPNLLLHSAISFEKINDLDNAATFYSTLIDMYPDSQEAQVAKKNIK